MAKIYHKFNFYEFFCKLGLTQKTVVGHCTATHVRKHQLRRATQELCSHSQKVKEHQYFKCNIEGVKIK